MMRFRRRISLWPSQVLPPQMTDWCGLELDHTTNLSYFLSNLPTYKDKQRNGKNEDKVKYKDKGKDWCGLELDHTTNLSYFISNLPTYKDIQRNDKNEDKVKYKEKGKD